MVMHNNTSRPTATATATGGVGFLGALSIAFIVLKLCGVIDWPWWQVLAPIYIPATVAVTLILGFVGVFLWACLVDAREKQAQLRERQGRPQPHEHGPAHRWRRP